MGYSLNRPQPEPPVSENIAALISRICSATPKVARMTSESHLRPESDRSWRQDGGDADMSLPEATTLLRPRPRPRPAPRGLSGSPGIVTMSPAMG